MENIVKQKSSLAIIWTLAAAIVLLGLRPAAAGTITGRLHVLGLPSPAGIMVYIEKGPVPSGNYSSGHFVMDQKNLTFIPHILTIPVGSTVAFPNNDKVNHNVFSLSRTRKFNLGSYGPGMSKSVVFDKPGIVELRCDIHAEMIAYIMVLKNPYAAVTDDQGRFRIPDPAWARAAGLPALPDLPAGTYTVKIWQEKLRPVTTEVTIPAHGNVNIEIKAERGPAGSVLYK